MRLYSPFAMPTAYRILRRNDYHHGRYRLLPIRLEDREAIRQWRNAQLDILRQAAPLTTEAQDRYFREVVGPLFAAVDAGLTSLDKFVHFQQFAQPALVAQYEALRVRPKTAAAHQFRAKGLTPYNVPQLAYNLHETDVPTPTLYNTGGRGHEVVFYLGATASSRPRPGQGLLVKNGKKVTLSDYSALGDAATEPYLLVLQTSELAAGGWRVRG